MKDFIYNSIDHAYWWANLISIPGLRWIGRYYHPLHGSHRNPIYKAVWFWKSRGLLWRSFLCKTLGHRIIPGTMTQDGLPGCWRCHFNFIPL